MHIVVHPYVELICIYICIQPKEKSIYESYVHTYVQKLSKSTSAYIQAFFFVLGASMPKYVQKAKLFLCGCVCEYIAFDVASTFAITVCFCIMTCECELFNVFFYICVLVHTYCMYLHMYIYMQTYIFLCTCVYICICQIYTILYTYVKISVIYTYAFVHQ